MSRVAARWKALAGGRFRLICGRTSCPGLLAEAARPHARPRGGYGYRRAGDFEGASSEFVMSAAQAGYWYATHPDGLIPASNPRAIGPVTMRWGDTYVVAKGKRAPGGTSERLGRGRRPLPEGLQSTEIAARGGYGLVGQVVPLPASIICPKCGSKNSVDLRDGP